ncbi:MAG: SCO family protein [Polyangiaceae bacterium]
MVHWLKQLRAARARLRHALSATVVLLALTGVAIAHFNEPRKNPKPSNTPAVSEPSLGAFSFTDQRGKPVDKSSLNGHVWIADFVFTTCTSACPLITSRFVTLQRRLTDERLRFVSFSVDPERDTESTLAQYAARWASTESRWQLLRTEQAGLNAVLSGLRVGLDREQGEIIHTSRLFLVDARGTLVGSYDSADDGALDQLVSRTRELLGVPAVTGANATVNGSGAELFANLGCAGCHADPQLAPPLGGLAGSHVMLERAGSIPADDTYLAESIAAPASKRVAGYPNSMPNYGALLSAAQVQSLVGYVRSLSAQSTSAHSGSPDAAPPQTDPVCGMSVRITQQTPSVEYQGKTYHFCSAACSQRFSADPQKYLAGKHTTSP